MANNYNMDLVVRGRKESLDQMQEIFQQEIDEGQTPRDWYTVYKSIRRMGFDPEKIDERRAYMEYVQRNSDEELAVRYVGAWSPQPGVLFCIRQRWPDVTITWQGMDEFGQDPMTNDPALVGKYRIEDDDEGINPFTELSEWVGEEALPTINRYYGTDCKTLQEAFDTIEKLLHTEQMRLFEESNDE